MAETARGSVKSGADPVAERKAARMQRLEAEAETRRQRDADAFTLAKLLDAWEERGLASRRASYRTSALSRLRDGLAGMLSRPAAGVTRTDAAKALQVFAETRGPVGANRVMAYARACYGWAMKADLLGTNPFSGLPAPGRETARDRVLSAEEVRAVWRAAGTLDGSHGAFVRVLLLTLQRREDVAGATWSEFSRDLTTWTIPAERAKNGRAHLVHLAPAVRDILAELPRMQPKQGQAAGDVLVFPVWPSGGKLTAFSAIKKRLDAVIAADEAKVAERDGREPDVIPPWTFHDFRRSGVTALAGMGFPPHVCDRLLNHVTGAIQGVAAVYQRAEFLAERRAALEAWAGSIER